MLSETGEYVAFESEARNLDPAANFSGSRVYRRQIGPGDSTVLVTRRTGATGAAVAGTEPSISDDGNRIAFTSNPSEAVVAADDNTFNDIYVRDMAAGTTVLASRADGAGDVGNGNSRSPSIAGNGSSVAFESGANQFDHDHDSDTSPDVYRRTLTTNTTALVSITAGDQKGKISMRPSLDDSGDVVGFISSATVLDPDDPDPARDAYVKNLATNEIEVASRADGANGKVANAGAAAVAVSGDGTRIGHRHGQRRDRARSRSAPRGRRAARAHRRPAHGPGLATGGNRAVRERGRLCERWRAERRRPLCRVWVVRPGARAAGRGRVGDLRPRPCDRRGHAREPSRRSLGRPVPGRPTSRPRSAPTAAAWRSPWGTARIAASGCATSPPAGRSWPAGRTGPRVSRPTRESRYPALDADGSRVLFSSNATNLGDGDADNLLDIHVRDLDSGRTILASRGAGGAKGDGDSGIADISADGNRVAFVSYATNLGDGDTDVQPDIHLRDLAAETTTLVDATPDGTKADAGAPRLSLDASARAWRSSRGQRNLPGGTGQHNQIYVRDLAANTLVLASRQDGAVGAPGAGESFGPEISPDGGSVAFASQAADLFAWNARPESPRPTCAT